MPYDGGAGSIPSWNGNPASFRDWKTKVTMWKHSVELNKRKSWSAALAKKLTGDAARAVMAFSDADWMPWGAALHPRTMRAGSR